MENKERTRAFRLVMDQLSHCEKCMNTLRNNLTHSMAEQDGDPFERYSNIKHHHRHANDVIYIRRQLLKLEKLLRG